MRYPKPKTTSPAMDRLIDVVCGVVSGLAHGVSVGLRWSIARTARLLQPVPWSIRFGIGTAILTVALAHFAVSGFDWVHQLGELTDKQLATLAKEGLTDRFSRLAMLAGVLSIICLLGTFLAFWRKRWSLLVLKICGAGFVIVWAYAAIYLFEIPTLLFEADHKAFTKMHRGYALAQYFSRWLPFALAGVVHVLALLTRSVYDFYGQKAPVSQPLGDRVAADLKSHGEDPAFRTSTYWAAFLHISVLFILPIIVLGSCMQKPYGIPKGSGNPVVRVIKVKQVQKKKEEEFVLNMDSSILFYRPKLDDSKVFEKILEETEATYKASSLKSGKLGKGGGDKGGWPNGMENVRVRFIRLEYGGGDWDQDMGIGSDYNMLIEFSKLTGFNIASNTEHIPIKALRRFPKDRAPPFVFLTGSSGVNASPRDVKTLRWYCLEEGGLLFADNGGGTFNNGFRSLIARVFPEKDWVDISNDDILYQQPFLFPKGAPPLWHHSGTRAMGIKHNGRWVVFYHQGDVNDAWKTGHSGATQQKASMAYKLGVNIMNYAFNRYYEQHYE